MSQSDETAFESVLTRIRLRHERLNLLAHNPGSPAQDPRRTPAERPLGPIVMPPNRRSPPAGQSHPGDA